MRLKCLKFQTIGCKIRKVINVKPIFDTILHGTVCDHFQQNCFRVDLSEYVVFRSTPSECFLANPSAFKGEAHCRPRLSLSGGFISISTNKPPAESSLSDASRLLPTPYRRILALSYSLAFRIKSGGDKFQDYQQSAHCEICQRMITCSKFSLQCFVLSRDEIAKSEWVVKIGRPDPKLF